MDLPNCQKGKKRGPYKKYDVDSEAKVPRATRWRQKTADNPITSKAFAQDVESGTHSTELLANQNESQSDLNDPTKDINIDQGDEDCAKGYANYADDEEQNECHEEHDNSDETQESEPSESQPLYDGCPITLSASMLLVMTFAIRHQLTAAAMKDLLVLIEMHLVCPNIFRKSYDSFCKFFEALTYPLKKIYVCLSCGHYNGGNYGLCQLRSCQKPIQTEDYFLWIPLAEQLANYLPGKCSA